MQNSERVSYAYIQFTSTFWLIIFRNGIWDVTELAESVPTMLFVVVKFKAKFYLAKMSNVKHNLYKYILIIYYIYCSLKYMLLRSMPQRA